MFLLITFKNRGVAAITSAFHYDMDVSLLVLGPADHTDPASPPPPDYQSVLCLCGVFKLKELAWLNRGGGGGLKGEGGEIITFHDIKGDFCSADNAQ